MPLREKGQFPDCNLRLSCLLCREGERQNATTGLVGTVELHSIYHAPNTLIAEEEGSGTLSLSLNSFRESLESRVRGRGLGVAPRHPFRAAGGNFGHLIRRLRVWSAIKRKNKNTLDDLCTRWQKDKGKHEENKTCPHLALLGTYFFARNVSSPSVSERKPVISRPLKDIS